MRHTESYTQSACVRWFRLQYPQYSLLLNSVPNGLLTSATQARIAVAEGLTKGVADLELNIARGSYNGLKIEMKKDELVYRKGELHHKKGYQSAEQREWEKAVTEQGYKYIICYSLDDFQREVTGYLGTKTADSIL